MGARASRGVRGAHRHRAVGILALLLAVLVGLLAPGAAAAELPFDWQAAGAAARDRLDALRGAAAWLPDLAQKWYTSHTTVIKALLAGSRDPGAEEPAQQPAEPEAEVQWTAEASAGGAEAAAGGDVPPVLNPYDDYTAGQEEDEAEVPRAPATRTLEEKLVSLDCWADKSCTELSADAFGEDLLPGPIPSEIGLLEDLVSVELGKHSPSATGGLTGPIPTEIGRLTKLKALELFGNELSGPIPAEVGRLTELMSLDVETNKMTGELPSELGLLSKLEILNLGGNKFTGAVPTELNALPELYLVSFFSNQLTGPVPTLAGSTKLAELILSFNDFTGELPASIFRNKGLEALVVNNNPQLALTIPPEVGELRDLQYFWAANTSLSGSIPSEMGLCEDMYYFIVANCTLSGALPEELGRWKDVIAFDISNNAGITGSVPETFTDWDFLEKFRALGTGLSGHAPSDLDCDECLLPPAVALRAAIPSASMFDRDDDDEL